MPGEHEVSSLDDILYDLEGTRKAEGRIAGFFSSEAEVVPRTMTRSLVRASSRGPARSCTGRSLLSRCAETTRRRYETLLFFEEQLPPDNDHGYLIGPACQILESELDRLLIAPSRSIAGSLIAALHVAPKDRPQAKILEKWAAGEVPSTIGTGSLVLMALRRGREQRLEPILEFLAARFDPAYEGLLASKQLGQCLDAIRTRFRNPTCHGTAVFDAEGYGTFARLVVANRRFATWDATGPDPADPDAAIGFLHHHLRRARPSGEGTPRVSDPLSPLEGPDPLERLLALRTPALSPLEIHLRPHRATESRGLREITYTPARCDRPFHLGDEIRFGMQANRTCYVALIDVGTSGSVAVVWPNAWCGDCRIEGGRPHFFPSIENPAFDFVLTGRAGRERVVALATAGPLAAPLLPESGAPFRVLTSREIGRIVDAVGREATGWAAAACELEILI